ncbi:hypothetical protein [Limnohabitans sp. Jir72]|uniref:hypothetical protein n=1 Tax=Limnohabitans sp. Jir72 TaxID=1977909 RepID=UPI000D3D8F5B|nr:hypothetical protein [Limnohabitans sp. Jir72]PUE30552.1 hypothetical protein B9Z52_12520 [Limnohabitans sp. Jir72]
MKKFFLVLWCASACALAQTAADTSAVIAKEREDLAAQRQRVLDVFEERSQDCWQKFAVNNCIIQARRIRRTDLQPIRQAELALNDRERQWRTQQRDERLKNKPSESTAKP